MRRRVEVAMMIVLPSFPFVVVVVSCLLLLSSAASTTATTPAATAHYYHHPSSPATSTTTRCYRHRRRGIFGGLLFGNAGAPPSGGVGQRSMTGLLGLRRFREEWQQEQRREGLPQYKLLRHRSIRRCYRPFLFASTSSSSSCDEFADADATSKAAASFVLSVVGRGGSSTDSTSSADNKNKEQQRYGRISDDEYILTDEQIEQFRRDGCVTIDNVLTELEVSEIENVFDMFLSGEIDVPGKDFCDMYVLLNFLVLAVLCAIETNKKLEYILCRLCSLFFAALSVLAFFFLLA